jgi:hypothetical protein
MAANTRDASQFGVLYSARAKRTTATHKPLRANMFPRTVCHAYPPVFMLVIRVLMSRQAATRPR